MALARPFMFSPAPRRIVDPDLGLSGDYPLKRVAAMIKRYHADSIAKRSPRQFSKKSKQKHVVILCDFSVEIYRPAIGRDTHRASGW